MTSLSRIANRLATNTTGDLARRVKSDDKNRILLLDTSGSMSSMTDNVEKRKIDALRQVVYDLRADGHRFKQIVFGSSVEMREDIPEPDGGTPLTEAIQLAKEHRPGRLIVISDGIPDSPGSAVSAAKELGIPVDCFYVGPRPSAGEVFMTQLADATNGSSHVGDLGAGVKALAAEVKAVLMIGDGRSEAIPL